MKKIKLLLVFTLILPTLIFARQIIIKKSGGRPDGHGGLTYYSVSSNDNGYLKKVNCSGDGPNSCPASSAVLHSNNTGNNYQEGAIEAWVNAQILSGLATGTNIVYQGTGDVIISWTTNPLDPTELTLTIDAPIITYN